MRDLLYSLMLEFTMIQQIAIAEQVGGTVEGFARTTKWSKAEENRM